MGNLLFWGRDKMNKVTNEKLLISLRKNSWIALASWSRPSSICMLMCSCSCLEATELCLTQAVKWNVTLIYCSHSRFAHFEFIHTDWYSDMHVVSSVQFPKLVSCVFLLHPEASVEATHIISAISEVPSVPAPCDTEATLKGTQTSLGLVSIWCSVSWYPGSFRCQEESAYEIFPTCAKITQISVFKCIFGMFIYVIYLCLAL